MIVELVPGVNIQAIICIICW